jgi:hypothetical protein
VVAERHSGVLDDEHPPLLSGKDLFGHLQQKTSRLLDNEVSGVIDLIALREPRTREKTL